MPDLTETLGRAGVSLSEGLAGEDDLEAVQTALSRETVLRGVMAETGEDRQTVMDMIDAMQSMNEEAVLSLTEGEPTTLHDALSRYVDSVDLTGPPVDPGVLSDDLNTLLAYPWPGEDGPDDPVPFTVHHLDGTSTTTGE